MHPLLNITGRGFVFPFISTIFAVVFHNKDCVFIPSLPVAKCGGFFYLCTNKSDKEMEQVNHPQHYTTYDVETLDMMSRIWGVQETISFCKLNAFKYRMRAGHKDNAQQDIDKALWYENKMKELSACIPE